MNFFGEKLTHLAPSHSSCMKNKTRFDSRHMIQPKYCQHEQTKNWYRFPRSSALVSTERSMKALFLRQHTLKKIQHTLSAGSLLLTLWHKTQSACGGPITLEKQLWCTKSNKIGNSLTDRFHVWMWPRKNLGGSTGEIDKPFYYYKKLLVSASIPDCKGSFKHHRKEIKPTELLTIV